MENRSLLDIYYAKPNVKYVLRYIVTYYDTELKTRDIVNTVIPLHTKDSETLLEDLKAAAIEAGLKDGEKTHPPGRYVLEKFTVIYFARQDKLP